MAIFRIGTVPAVAALAGIVLAIALGNWQSGRAQEKLELQRQMSGAAVLAPVELTVTSAPSFDPESLRTSLRYRQVRVSGTWQPEAVVYLDNRAHAGQAGLHVLMPLIIDRPAGAAPVAVIVNRGWLPRNVRERTAIAPYVTPSGAIVLDGHVLANEPKLLELGTAPPLRIGGLWQNFDFDAYAAASGLAPLPLIVRQNPGSAGSADSAGSVSDGLVRDWTGAAAPLSEQISKHHGYAFQWYALAALLAGLALFFEVRKRRVTQDLQ